MRYQEIARDLADKINNKYYTDKLPSESELMEEYSTSRNTVRNALDTLYNQGIIKRVQGSGCFVSKPLHGHDEVINMANKVGFRALGDDFCLRSDVLDLEVVPAGREISRYMGCGEKSPVYHVKRLRYNGDELFSLEDAYYLKSEVPYISPESCEKSIFRFIEDVYGIDIRSGDEYLSVHELTEEEAELTGSPVGRPVLLVEEVNYLKNDLAFNYSKSYYFRRGFTAYFHIGNHMH